MASCSLLADNAASVASELAGVEFDGEPGDGLGCLPAHRSQPYTGYDG